MNIFIIHPLNISNPPIQCETNFLEVSQAKSLIPSLCHSVTNNLEHLFLACHFSSLSLNGLKSSWTPSAINLAPEDHLHLRLFAVSASDLIGLTRNRLIQDNSVPSASQLVSLVKKVSLDHLHAWESISPAPQIILWALLGCLSYWQRKKIIKKIIILFLSQIWFLQISKDRALKLGNPTKQPLGFWLLIKIEDLTLWWLLYGKFLNN
jgi:hypothetical protein